MEAISFKNMNLEHLKNQFNMKSVFSSLTIVIAFTVISCSPAKNDSAQSTQQPVIPPIQDELSSVVPEKLADENSDAAPLMNSEEDISQVTINPPHGEPGHRCDIPVGAPLETSPAKASEVAINPPHGDPGHRCDIPVGAPLNSPPANTSPQITSSPSTGPAPSLANNPMAPTIENAQRLTSSQPRATTTTQNSGRINPPHGQPGHRCDIAVGSPLP